MNYSLDLSIVTPLQVGPALTEPVLTADGPRRPFPELLAEATLPAMSVRWQSAPTSPAAELPEAGNAMPEPAIETGKVLPMVATTGTAPPSTPPSTPAQSGVVAAAAAHPVSVKMDLDAKPDVFSRLQVRLTANQTVTQPGQASVPVAGQDAPTLSSAESIGVSEVPDAADAEDNSPPPAQPMPVSEGLLLTPQIALAEASMVTSAETGTPQVVVTANGGLAVDVPVPPALAVKLSTLPQSGGEVAAAGLTAPHQSRPEALSAGQSALVPSTQAAEVGTGVDNPAKADRPADAGLVMVEPAPLSPRSADTGLPIAPVREPVALTTPVPAAMAMPTDRQGPGSQLEQLIEVLAQAREAGRGARGDLTLRHADFGTVGIRIEQADGETRAILAGRDPAFAPAVIAALADRAGSNDLNQPQGQRPTDNSAAQTGSHSTGQQTSTQGEPKHSDRRHVPAQERHETAGRNHANSDDADRADASAGRSRGRFA